jgi:hypothetical protein
MVTAPLSFFRYLRHAEQWLQTSRGLCAHCPQMVAFHASPVSSGCQYGTYSEVLDQETSVGRRSYAILLLLARLDPRHPIPARYTHRVAIRPAQRFSGIVRQAGMNIILSNRADWDRSKINLPTLANRAPGSLNPCMVGNAKVLNFLKVAEECVTASVVRVN